ncbi:c-type cytochrome biogenesis protein CcsB [Nocardioides sp.]|uniref:c-type cytochrome biogenesis protein CcsB n=1 Tax=Nocardioides sp. TaxID=35761 RepID=UPI002ED507F0
MTDAGWEALSNQAVAGAGVLYFLALLALLAELVVARRVAEPADATAYESGAAGGLTVAIGPDAEAPTDADDRRREAFFGRLGLLLTGLAVVVHGFALLCRGLAADPNRVPWGNMYEFTLSGTFWIALLFLVALRRFALAWMAPVVVGVVLSLLMLAVLVLYAPIAPLTEALNSPWLVIHVVAAIIATAAFTLGGISSVLYLLKSREGASSKGYLARVPAPADLDRLSYRLHAFAFPVWTFAVLIAGPIWAYEAWSRYWGWDPKEVWALITWVVYAAYLHARATAGWRGRKAAWLAIVGVATLWFNFVGINYFSSTSQHAYAAPASHHASPEVGNLLGESRT